MENRDTIWCYMPIKMAPNGNIFIGDENVFDFSLGNPATPAPEKFGQAIKEIIEIYKKG